jgi:hypothetical protein
MSKKEGVKPLQRNQQAYINKKGFGENLSDQWCTKNMAVMSALFATAIRSLYHSLRTHSKDESESASDQDEEGSSIDDGQFSLRVQNRGHDYSYTHKNINTRVGGGRTKTCDTA